MNANRDSKKRSNPYTVSEIAPWLEPVLSNPAEAEMPIDEGFLGMLGLMASGEGEDE